MVKDLYTRRYIVILVTIEKIFHMDEISSSREIAAATAKSLQSCPTLCDPIDSSPRGSTIPEILQARTLEWVAREMVNIWQFIHFIEYYAAVYNHFQKYLRIWVI